MLDAEGDQPMKPLYQVIDSAARSLRLVTNERDDADVEAELLEHSRHRLDAVPAGGGKFTHPAVRHVDESYRQFRTLEDLIVAKKPDGLPRVYWRGDDPRAVVRKLLGAQCAVIEGPTGAGKSTLSGFAFEQWVIANPKAGMKALWVRASVLERSVGFNERESALLSMAKNASLLVIDDVGNESQTLTNPIKNLIDDRYATTNSSRQTWITTGYTPEEIGSPSLYGEHLARRIWLRTVIGLGRAVS